MFTDSLVTDFGMTALPVAGLSFAVRQSNWSGQIIILVLFVGSIFAWSTMLTKLRELKQSRRVSRLFLTAYRKEPHPASLFIRGQKFSESPIFSIYEKACGALGSTFEARGGGAQDLFAGSIGAPGRQLSEIQVRGVRNVAERAMTDGALLLENKMGFLATATTAAPLLGLLGTVWGVMDAFAGMSITGSAMLSAVAPGISGALLTTVVGLLVALPSGIGYNILSDQIRRMSVEMDNFVQEFMSDVEHHYLE